MTFKPQYLTIAGDACRMAGQWQAALQHFVEARRLVEDTGELWCQAETLRVNGHLLSAMGDRTGAEPSYHEAIAITRQQSAKLWQLRAATGGGEVFWPAARSARRDCIGINRLRNFWNAILAPR
jgi:hypothetical protein